MPELNTHRHRASRWNRRRTAAVAAFATLSIGGTLIYTVTAQAAVTCKDTVWKAKYYANTTFKGDPKKTVCDTTISENYGTGDPAGVTLPKDNFGVRWEMKRNYGSGGPFAFTVAVQDGIRVYLDGTRKVNIWKNVSSTQKKTVNLTVPKGTHTIRVDFAAFTGKANVKFTYAPRTSKTVDKVKPLTPSGAKAAYSKTTGKTAVTWSRNVEMDLALQGLPAPRRGHEVDADQRHHADHHRVVHRPHARHGRLVRVRGRGRRQGGQRLGEHRRHEDHDGRQDGPAAADRPDRDRRGRRQQPGLGAR
jgi:hypothetical protein